MLTKTWPYGTTKRARVLKVERTFHQGVAVKVIALEELDSNEGHILVENEHHTPGVRVGDTGNLVFTRGGPFGGYFRFTRDET